MLKAKTAVDGKIRWAKWKFVPLLAGLASGCGSKQAESDGCFLVQDDGGPQACYCTKDGVAIEGTLTSQGCVPGTPAPACPACSGATVTGLLNPDNPADSTLTSGGIAVRLDLTGQSGQTQIATVDVLDCGQLVGSSSIPSGGMKTFKSGSTNVTVSIGEVSIGTPRSAQVEAAVTCGK